MLRQSRGPIRVGALTLCASVLFFVVTNLGEWAFQPWYPKTGAGLAASYVAGIPFFRNMLLGDLAYSALLFGGFALLERRFAALRTPGFSPA
jgi:hypothetical protein